MGRFRWCRRSWLWALAALAACAVLLGPAHAAQSYTYDENGNRTGNGAGQSVTYTPGSDRIATVNGVAITLDAAGNLTNDGTLAYTWDAAGRLKSVSQGATLLATYFYDYRNRRTRKETTAAAPQGAGTVVYHYDQWDRLIGETRGDGTPLRTYAWQEEQPLAVIEHAAIAPPPSPERILYLELDQLGTPRKAKDATGKVHWRWDSDGYGSTQANEDPDEDGVKTTVNLRFPGQYYDRESALHYNWNRYYSPKLGRYISADPIGVTGGANLYTYVEGNPLDYTDPEGLQVAPPNLGGATGGFCGLGGFGSGSGSTKPNIYDNPNAILNEASLGSGSDKGLQEEIEREANHREYKNICSQQPPPGLDPCERAKWDLNKAKACKAAREENTRRWWGGTDNRHSSQLFDDLERQIRNAERAVERLCKCK